MATSASTTVSNVFPERERRRPAGPDIPISNDDAESPATGTRGAMNEERTNEMATGARYDRRHGRAHNRQSHACGSAHRAPPPSRAGRHRVIHRVIGNPVSPPARRRVRGICHPLGASSAVDPAGTVERPVIRCESAAQPSGLVGTATGPMPMTAGRTPPLHVRPAVRSPRGPRHHTDGNAPATDEPVRAQSMGNSQSLATGFGPTPGTV